MTRKAKIISKKRIKRTAKQVNFLDLLDSDADGLSDAQEKILGTDPFSDDTDRDGLSDLAETMVYHTDPLNPDTDADGVSDGNEVRWGTNPLRADKLKDILFPNAGNNYKPLLLEPKRVAFYSAFFIGVKAVVFMFAAALPLQAFMMPDVLAEQRDKIYALVSELRAGRDKPELTPQEKLKISSQVKASDMAQNEYFSHTGPDGRDLKYFLKQAGYEYRFAGENLAMGFSDAESVVNAWIKSPLHYQNLIDADFSETGIGLDSGYYQGRETIFITQHFGQPLVALAAAPENKPDAVNAVLTAPENADKILGQKVLTPADGLGNALPKTAVSDGTVRAPAKIIYDAERSQVAWKYDGKTATFNIQAFINGPAEKATVYLDSYAIDLQPDKTSANVYNGQLAVTRPIDDFFKVVINPAIVIESKTGERLTASIPWNSVKVVSPTPIERYLAAQDNLPASITKIFTFSRLFYLIALAVFVIVLLMTIFIKIKKQHPHIIVQSLAMIGLLAVLISI
jgi:uncharacterized protein YkwD